MPRSAGPADADRWEGDVDLRRAAAGVRRRWYVVLPLLALVAWTVWGLDGAVRREYEITATALVERGGAAEVNNPYRTVETASEAIVIVLDSAPTRQLLRDQGLIADYEVQDPTRDPVFSFTVRADREERGYATAEALLETARDELRSRQSAGGLPAEAQFAIHVLAPPATTATVGGAQVRVAGVVGVLGVGLSVLAATVTDRIASSRGRSAGQAPRLQPAAS